MEKVTKITQAMVDAGLPVISLSWKDGRVIDEQYSRKLTVAERALADQLIKADYVPEKTLEEKVSELEVKLAQVESVVKTAEKL